MLSTAGLVPVAQELCRAATPGLCGSEFSPVSAECPSAMMPRGGCDGEDAVLGSPIVACHADAAPENSSQQVQATMASPPAASGRRMIRRLYAASSGTSRKLSRLRERLRPYVSVVRYYHYSVVSGRTPGLSSASATAEATTGRTSLPVARPFHARRHPCSGGSPV